MIDLLSADRISFKDLAKRCGVHHQTVYAWANRGIRGHIMPSWKFSGRRVTTKEAFDEWQAELNGEPVRVETRRQSERALREAERRATELGV